MITDRYGYSIDYKLWWLMISKGNEGWRDGLTTFGIDKVVKCKVVMSGQGG